MAKRVWEDAAVVWNTVGQQKDKVVHGVKEPTRMQDWHCYWSWEKDDKCRSRCSGAEPFRGRGAFRVFSHLALLGATVLLLCCGSRIFGWEGAGCITSLSSSVPYSPWKTLTEAMNEIPVTTCSLQGYFFHCTPNKKNTSHTHLLLIRENATEQQSFTLLLPLLSV